MNGYRQSNPIIDENHFEIEAEGIPFVSTVSRPGNIEFMVTVDENIDLDRLRFYATHTSTDFGTSMVASLEIPVIGLTLNAPAYTGRTAMTFTGIAPAGSTVTLYDRGIPLCSTTLPKWTGAWTMKAELPGTEGVMYRHELVVKAEKDGETWSTEKEVMIYDQAYPKVVSIRNISAFAAGDTTYDISGGAVHVPFVVSSDISSINPIIAVFNDNDAVENVQIAVSRGGNELMSIPAKFDGTGYRALIDFEHLEALTDGGNSVSSSGQWQLYVKYDVIPGSWNKWDPETEPLTEEEIRNQLPTEYSDFEIDEESFEYSEDPETGEKKGSFSYLFQDDNINFTMSMRETAVDYDTTPAEDEFERIYGFPIYDADARLIYNADGTVSLKMSCIIPKSALGIPMSRLSVGAKAAIALNFEIGTFTLDRIDDALTHSGYNKLLDVQERLVSQCEGSALTNGMDYLEQIRDMMIANFIANSALSIAGALVAPATFGIGTAAIWGITFGYSQLLDQKVNDMFDHFDSTYMSSEECKDEEEDDNTKPKPKPKPKPPEETDKDNGIYPSFI
jgi:hypothetical protein